MPNWNIYNNPPYHQFRSCPDSSSLGIITSIYQSSPEWAFEIQCSFPIPAWHWPQVYNLLGWVIFPNKPSSMLKTDWLHGAARVNSQQVDLIWYCPEIGCCGRPNDEPNKQSLMTSWHHTCVGLKMMRFIPHGTCLSWPFNGNQKWPWKVLICRFNMISWYFMTIPFECPFRKIQLAMFEDCRG